MILVMTITDREASINYSIDDSEDEVTFITINAIYMYSTWWKY